MFMSDKTFSFIAGAVTCVLFLAVGCTELAEEAAKSKVESETTQSTGAPPAVEKTVEPEAEPKEQLPTVELTLKFAPRDSTTWRVITEAQKSVTWESSLPEKPSAFKGGHTGNKIEITFTQRIESVEAKGDAIAEITIEGLKYSEKIRDNTVLDFDGSREKDRDNPLSKLIGQSYTIAISPAGRVLKVVDVNEAQAAVQGSSSAHKTASTLLSEDAIKQRHTISALPVTEKNQLRKGDSWSSIKAFSFGMMGSRSYERIYTLKQVKDADNEQVAIVEMKAIPSSEMAEELHKQQVGGLFSKLFDNIETYTGRLKLDLTAGKVEEYVEELRTEWVAVDPSAGQEDKTPDALKMSATRLYRLEKID